MIEVELVESDYCNAHFNKDTKSRPSARVKLSFDQMGRNGLVFYLCDNCRRELIAKLSAIELEEDNNDD